MLWPWIDMREAYRRTLPQATYSSELLFAKRGTGIYYPQPVPRMGHKEPICVGISDVGFIQNNLFYPMFRASDSLQERYPDTVPAQGRDIPNQFVPIQVGPVNRGSHPAGIQCARNIGTSVIHDADNSGSLLKEGTVIRCSPTSSHGAALFTKYRVWHSDVADQGPFEDYMVKNYRSWRELCFRTRGRTDLLFVTGVDVSTYYTTVCYNTEPKVPSLDFIVTDSAKNAQFSEDHDDYKEWAYFSGHAEYLAGPYTRIKPDAESDDEFLQHLEENHENIATSSLFIRALRFQCRKIVLTDTYRSAKRWFGYGELPIDADIDPLQPIADYIFSHSVAWYALFGDNDIKEMIGDLRPDEDLHKLLKRLKPCVRVDKNFIGRIDPTFPPPKRWYSRQRVGNVVARLCERSSVPSSTSSTPVSAKK